MSAQVFVGDGGGDIASLADRAARLRDLGAHHLIVALTTPDISLLEQVASATSDL